MLGYALAKQNEASSQMSEVELVLPYCSIKIGPWP